MNRNYVSKLILKKSSKFLKVSIFLFAFSLILISTFLALFFNQYLQVKKDFIDNSNTHIIEVTLAENKDYVKELNFSDLSKITNAISTQSPDVGFIGINEYQLNFGIEDDKGNIYFLYAIDDAGAKFLGWEELKQNCLYSSDLKEDYIFLNIPIISIDGGGLSSSKTEPIEFSVEDNVPLKNPFSIYESPSAQTYISFDTYKSLIEKSYSISWDDFVTEYDNNNYFGIQAVYKIFIYVDNIQDVEDVASIIVNEGYSTNFTFKSFDNFDKSIGNTLLISVLLLIIVFVVTSANILLSFNSYLKIQQKDMGILKHYGYTSSDIRKIYAKNINRIFSSMAIFITIFILIVTLIFIKAHFFSYFLIIATAVLIPLYAVNRIITFCIIRKYSEQNILDLIKTNKEFE